MKKTLFAVLSAALIFMFSISFWACNKDNKATETVTFIHTSGTSLIDLDGNAFGLQGTNLGGWLVQEEWLCPTEVDGDFGQIDMMLALANRFDTDGSDGKQKMLDLISVYEDNWITETDFSNISGLVLNCVRIPFTYMNFYDVITYDADKAEYVRVPYADLQLRADAWDRLDFALEMCEKYKLYAILDLHGAVGSQSGNDHTGDISNHNGGLLWGDDETGAACRLKTKELWTAIATRYKDNRYVAAYDLMNEPGVKDASGNQRTTSLCWDYFDELYTAIRTVDPNHMISMESCWEAANLPSPSKYGWTNVLYQYHHYNWASADMTNETFYGFKVYGLNKAERDFPVLIGEFNVWGDAHEDKSASVGDKTQTDEIAWDGAMQLYTGMGWNYTTWTYKHAATYSSWGLYNLNEGYGEQADFFAMTYDQIKDIWSAHNSTAYHENTTLTATVKKYLSSFNTDGYDSDYVKSDYYILSYMSKK